MIRWFAASTKYGLERLALINLARQGFTAYCPYITIERIKNGRRVRDSEPLFPRYVLVNFELDNAAWRAVNNTRGVFKLISFGLEGTPAPIPIGEVERLQEQERRGELVIREPPRIKPGDRVRFKSGLAVDQIGDVIRTRGERVELLLALLGGRRRVSVPMHQLEVVSDPSGPEFHRLA